LALYAVEAAVFLVAAGLYKTVSYDSNILGTKGGVALFAGGVGLIISLAYLGWQVHRSGPSRVRTFIVGFTTNLLSVLMALLLAETVVRLAAKQTENGIAVGSVNVRPTWPELVAQSRRVLGDIASWGGRPSFFIFDPELGWTVGRNRQSSDGLYFSSFEGIRSPGPNIRMADERPRFRVALIGDSNAFSLEVPFEESWGYYLQRLLGNDVQILNFGVDGYGIDQTYLRYLRDVRPWKPDVVVVGFVPHDFVRTMAVYPFISMRWPGFLVKPRFVINSNEITLLNSHLPTPDKILGTRNVQDLPFVTYDVGYANSDWRWRFERGPMTLRVLTSVFPRWPKANRDVSDEAAKRLNSRLLAELRHEIEATGAQTLFVLMSGTSTGMAGDILAESHIPFMEMNPCVAKIPLSQRRVSSGYHYSGIGNHAIAECTAPGIERMLADNGVGR
jgi:hypothetical protein